MKPNVNRPCMRKAIADASVNLSALKDSSAQEDAVRVEALLNIIGSAEEMSPKLSEPALHEFLHSAILACGFRDEIEALRALLKLTYPELLSPEGCAYWIKP